jgi:hypothetical protein
VADVAEMLDVFLQRCRPVVVCGSQGVNVDSDPVSSGAPDDASYDPIGLPSPVPRSRKRAADVIAGNILRARSAWQGQARCNR